MFARSAADIRRRRWLASAALCLFALRALVPIGFMVSLEASHAAVVLCPDSGPLPPSLAAHAHHHHAQGAGAAGTDSTHGAGVDSHGLCPFAAAAHGGCHGLGSAVALAAPDSQYRFNADAADAAAPRLHPSFSRSPRGPPC